MKITKTSLKNLVLISYIKHEDNRGIFFRNYCKKELKKKNIHFVVRQTNVSINKYKYTLRGFHYQTKPFQEAKIITPISGSIFNVAIDLRKKSKTFLNIFSVILSEKNAKSIFIPQGFAHGFCTLSKENYIVYSCTKYRSKNDEITIKWDDPKLKNIWPIKKPILSSKDKRGIFLKEFLNKN